LNATIKYVHSVVLVAGERTADDIYQLRRKPEQLHRVVSELCWANADK